MAEFAYNAFVNRTTGKSPVEVVYGIILIVLDRVPVGSFHTAVISFPVHVVSISRLAILHLIQ